MQILTDRVDVRLKPGDKKKILRRMDEAGMVSMSAFIRKMALDGYLVRLDLSDVKEIFNFHLNAMKNPRIQHMEVFENGR